MSNERPNRINIWFVAFCAAVTGIGGFLFGYDTAVINGANSLLQKNFHLDIEENAFLIGLATSSAIIGCIVGAMSAGFFSDRFGRRKVLFFCAVLYAASGVLCAMSWSFTSFMVARIVNGIAIGVSSMICPVYIAEIAPPQWRGRLGHALPARHRCGNIYRIVQQQFYTVPRYGRVGCGNGLAVDACVGGIARPSLPRPVVSHS